MSARRIETTGAQPNHHSVTLEARQARLSLSPNSVVLHKNGIEFRSSVAFVPWTEVTLTLQSPPRRDRPPTTRHLTRLEAHCAAEDNTSRCVPPLVAPGNPILDARAPATKRSHPPDAWRDGKFPHCATVFRNRRPRSTGGYEIFRFQKSDIQAATSLGPGMGRNALPSLTAVPPPVLLSRC